MTSNYHIQINLSNFSCSSSNNKVIYIYIYIYTYIYNYIYESNIDNYDKVRWGNPVRGYNSKNSRSL